MVSSLQSVFVPLLLLGTVAQGYEKNVLCFLMFEIRCGVLEGCVLRKIHKSARKASEWRTAYHQSKVAAKTKISCTQTLTLRSI